MVQRRTPAFVLLASVLVAGVHHGFGAPLSTPDPIFPEYTFTDHPLYTLPEFEGSRPVPVIMRKYYRFLTKSGVRRVLNMRFLPRIATYTDGAGEKVMDNLDALFVQTNPELKNLEHDFLEVHLNAAARVVLLLEGASEFRMATANVDDDSISGLPTGWHSPKIVRRHIEGSSTTGGRADGARLPFRAVAVENSFDASKPIRIPSMLNVRVNGEKPTRIALLFAQDEEGPLRAFPAPALPTAAAVEKIAPNVHALVTPQPNAACPDWLHDIHVVKSVDATGPRYWRTWHPTIDSIYWCYYRHDHGSYPGKFRPAFGYTAYHTRDGPMSDRSQNESHKGFKVFSWALKKRRTAIVATLHAHLSRPRRFSARNHTVVFAAHDVDTRGNWDKLLLFHMKMDFGAAAVHREHVGDEPANTKQAEIQQEMDDAKVIAMRRFMVANDTLTAGVNGLANERYEKWFGVLNTCASAPVLKNGLQVGFDFNFLKPPTGLANLEPGLKEQEWFPDELRDGLRRRVVIDEGGFNVERKSCNFNDTDVPFQARDGVFFTDSYFHTLKRDEGQFHARQFMRDGFDSLHVEPGRVFVTDRWPSHMAYVPVGEEQVLTDNLEGAVNRTVN